MTAGISELADLVEEVSKGYAEKFGIRRDSAWFVLKLQEEVGELTQAFLALTGQGRSKGKTGEMLRASLEDELADVFAHVLLLAKHYEVDIEAEVVRKWLSWLGPGRDPGPSVGGNG